MEQGKNILESLEVLKVELEDLKSKSETTTFSDCSDTIIKQVNDLQAKLPKIIHHLTISHYTEYIARMKEIEQKVLELRKLTKTIELLINIEFIVGVIIYKCQKKAENKLEEKLKRKKPKNLKKVLTTNKNCA